MKTVFELLGGFGRRFVALVDCRRKHESLFLLLLLFLMLLLLLYFGLSALIDQVVLVGTLSDITLGFTLILSLSIIVASFCDFGLMKGLNLISLSAEVSILNPSKAMSYTS